MPTQVGMASLLVIMRTEQKIMNTPFVHDIYQFDYFIASCTGTASFVDAYTFNE